MDFIEGKDLLLQGLIILTAGYVGHTLNRLVNSTQSLNLKIAKILERLENHGSTLTDHSQRIVRLEDKV